MSDVLNPITETQPAPLPVHPAAHLSRAERKQEVLKAAHQLWERSKDWVSFYRQVLGVGGIARQLFRSLEDQAEFEISEEFAQIQKMVAKLREQGDGEGDGREPTRVITVRLPKSLHESLRSEAEVRDTSMNKLCISKLLQYIDNELVPKD